MNWGKRAPCFVQRLWELIRVRLHAQDVDNAVKLNAVDVVSSEASDSVSLGTRRRFRFVD